MSELRRVLCKYVDASGDPCSVLHGFIVDLLDWHDEVMMADKPMVPLEDKFWDRCPRCGDSLCVVNGIHVCVRCEEEVL
jgi:hypothetical protein